MPTHPLSLGPVAKALRVSVSSVRRLCEAGRVPGAFRTRGGHWRIKAINPYEVAFIVTAIDQQGEINAKSVLLLIKFAEEVGGSPSAGSEFLKRLFHGEAGPEYRKIEARRKIRSSEKIARID